MYSDTFNISHILCLFAIVYKMIVKYDKKSFKLCKSKFILIMSDNFDRKLCNKLSWIAVKFKYTIR